MSTRLLMCLSRQGWLCHCRREDAVLTWSRNKVVKYWDKVFG